MYDFHHLLFSGIYDFEDFTEMMRALQYPRVVSIESFRAPNFELVADILFWMLKRYDPDIYIHEGIESEDDRVVFLTCVAKAMETRAGIILNIKKLYAADGFAVKELLKISTILYQALQTVCTNYVEEASVLNIQLKDAMVAKSLASDITEIGAKLHGLLNCEVKNKELRERVIRFLSSVTGAAEDAPEKAVHIKYGSKIQMEEKDNSPHISAARIKHIKYLVGTFAWYAREVYPTMAETMSSIASRQSKCT